MTKFSLPGLIAAWTAAVAALGSSSASACMGPGFHGNIFFSELGLPEVGGTVAAYVEIVDRPLSGGTADKSPTSFAVVAHVDKVVKGKIDQASGAVKENIGRVKGDPDLENRGADLRASGKLEAGFGKSRRKMGEAVKDLGDKLGK